MQDMKAVYKCLQNKSTNLDYVFYQFLDNNHQKIMVTFFLQVSE